MPDKILSREERIALAESRAPQNATEARECRALGYTVEVNADMLALLQEDNAALQARIVELTHRLDLSRVNVENWQARFAELEAERDSLRKERDEAREDARDADQLRSNLECQLAVAISQRDIQQKQNDARKRIIKTLTAERDAAVEAGKADKARFRLYRESAESGAINMGAAMIEGIENEERLEAEISALRTKLEAVTQPVDLPVTGTKTEGES